MTMVPAIKIIDVANWPIINPFLIIVPLAEFLNNPFKTVIG